MSTFTVNKNIEQPAHNADVDAWDTPVNADWALIDTCFGGSASLNSTGLSGNQVLSINQYQPLALNVSGMPSGPVTYVVPSGVGGMWVFKNNSTGGFSVGIASAAGGGTLTVPAGTSALVTCDGTATGMTFANSTPPAAAGTNQQVQYNSGGILAGSPNFTFDGTNLNATGLFINGSSTLGAAAGNSLTLNGTTLNIPNGVTIGSGSLLVLNNSTGQIGMKTGPVGGFLLTMAGGLKFTTNGITFSDNTQLLSAAALAPSGSTGNLQFNNGSGGFGAVSTLTFNQGTNTLFSPNLTLSGAIAANSGSTTGNFTIGGNLAVTGTSVFTGQITIGSLGAGSPWTGTIAFFGGPLAKVPGNALLCFGQAVSRTTYAALFSVIGTAFGAGDGSTTFNLPDMRGVVPVGLDNMGGTARGVFPGLNTMAQFAGNVNNSTTVSLSSQAPTTNSGGQFGYAATGNYGTASFSIVQPSIGGNWIIYT